MNKALYYSCVILTLGFSSYAYSDTIYYKGTIKVKNTVVSAKATYEEFSYLPGPTIKITYEIAGEEYLTPYMSEFGDKLIRKSGSIIVYNESADKKQNYYYQGQEVSWLKMLLP